jgi:hypothetical protein
MERAGGRGVDSKTLWRVARWAIVGGHEKGAISGHSGVPLKTVKPDHILDFHKTAA